MSRLPLHLQKGRCRRSKVEKDEEDDDDDDDMPKKQQYSVICRIDLRVTAVNWALYCIGLVDRTNFSFLYTLRATDSSGMSCRDLGSICQSVMSWNSEVECVQALSSSSKGEEWNF